MPMENEKKLPLIKMCGIRKKEELQWLKEEKVDFAGFVLFYPKSHRNLSPSEMRELLPYVDKSIKKVAVVVSPEKEEIEQVETMGFDYIQIHGMLNESVYESCKLPIIKAIQDKDEIENDSLLGRKKIKYLLYDAKEPGSGISFDWRKIPKKESRPLPVILAGGLTCENIVEAIATTNPDMVDVSSGIEKEDKSGKEKNKIKTFVRMVRYGK